jgi:MFS transporter, DHA3 family, macrolide efflux protein
MKFRVYTRVFQNKNYIMLFLSQVTSQLGSVTGLIAFTFYILDRFHNQPGMASITEMMYSLPTLFLFFLTGVIADSFDRKKIAMICELVCFVLSLLLLSAILTGHMPLIFSLLFIRSGVSKFFPPAQTSLLQGVLSKEDYPLAMGLNTMLSSIFFLTGTGIGVFIYWNFGVEGAILIDALSFLLSGLFISLVNVPKEVRIPNGEISIKEFSITTVYRNFIEGVLYTKNYPLLLSLLLGIVIIGIVNGGTSVMHIFIMKYKLAPEVYEQIQIGLTAAVGGGVLTGSIIATYLSKKIPLFKLIIASFIISGIIPFMQSITNDIWLYSIFHFIFGTSIPLCNVAFFGWLGQIVDPRMMGRIKALTTPLMMVSLVTMQGFIAVAFPKYLPVEGIFYLVGTASLLTAFYYMIRLPKLVRDYNDRELKEDSIKSTK